MSGQGQVSQHSSPSFKSFVFITSVHGQNSQACQKPVAPCLCFIFFFGHLTNSYSGIVTGTFVKWNKITLISVRSLLDGSDTISIDTAMVSSQEFGCLLDMVYTGKLPLGKHNVSRIIAAADSLQMFDVAVGFKNVLTSLVNQQPPIQLLSTQTPTLTLINKAQSLNPEGSSSPNDDHSTSDQTEPVAELKTEDCQGDSEDVEEPACKRTCVELSESSGKIQLLTMSKAGFWGA